MVLSKADILAGSSRRQEVEIEALGGVVALRPLTDAEYAQVQNLLLSSISMDINLSGLTDGELSRDDLKDRVFPEFDVQKFGEAEYSSNTMAAAFGLSCDETWTPEEVGQLPAGAVEKVANEVYRISGVSPGQEEMLQHFREDGGRPGRTPTQSVRGTVSSHASGVDSRPTSRST